MENRSIHDDVWLAPWDPEWAHKYHMEKQSIVGSMMAEFAWADIIVSVSPSYWTDIPGQYKAFIDRCTPWCNTHEPHITIPLGKKRICDCAAYRSWNERMRENYQQYRTFLRSPGN